MDGVETDIAVRIRVMDFGLDECWEAVVETGRKNQSEVVEGRDRCRDGKLICGRGIEGREAGHALISVVKPRTRLKEIDTIVL